jgi:hypothetical protein
MIYLLAPWMPFWIFGTGFVNEITENTLLENDNFFIQPDLNGILKLIVEKGLICRPFVNKTLILIPTVRKLAITDTYAAIQIYLFLNADC